MSLELYHPNEDGVVVYRTEDNTLQLDVQLAEETVWLAQQQMAVLFDTTKQNVSLHINNIFREGELDKISVVKDYLTTASDGKKRWYCKTCQTYFTHVNHKASILNICFFILSCYLSIASAFWRADLRNLKVRL